MSQLHDVELSLPLDVRRHCPSRTRRFCALGSDVAVGVCELEFSVGAEVWLCAAVSGYPGATQSSFACGGARWRALVLGSRVLAGRLAVETLRRAALTGSEGPHPVFTEDVSPGRWCYPTSSACADLRTKGPGFHV